MSEFITSVAYHIADDTDVQYMVQPYFNYVALDYNERQDMQMPCLYSEYVYEPRNAPDTYKDCQVGDGKFGKEYKYGEYSKRYLFDNESLPTLTPEQIEKISNLYILGKNFRTLATNSVRKFTGTDEISGHFPQHVKISLGGNKLKPITGGLLEFLISSRVYYGDQATYYMPYFVRNVIEKYTIGSDGNLKRDRDNNVSTILDENVVTDSLYKFRAFDPDDAFVQIDPISDQIGRRRYINHLLTHIDTLAEELPLYYDETIFYEVQKRVGTEVIQTFYVCISDTDSTEWEFVDTQVKPQVEYNYVCYSWKYFAFDKTLKRSDNTQVFNQTIKIEQPPLPVPSVTFALENDVKNKYKFSIGLDLSVNSEHGPFYEMFAGEEDELKAREELFNIHGTKTRFVYETQEGIYEIYKSTTQPYESKNGKYRAVDLISSSETIVSTGGTSLQYLQSVQSFKKYYYVIRAINAYGYPSNPTPIYEVEMTEDADEVFLNTKVVDFVDPTKDKYKNFKTMMKLMQIIPSSEQLFFEPGGALSNEQIEGDPLLDSEGRQYLGYRNDDNNIVYTGYVDIDGSYVFYPNISPEFQNISLPLKQRGPEVDSLTIFDDMELPTLGISENDSMWKTFDPNGTVKDKGKRFKIRVVSNDSGRKIDLNVSFELKKN